MKKASKERLNQMADAVIAKKGLNTSHSTVLSVMYQEVSWYIETYKASEEEAIEWLSHLML